MTAPLAARGIAYRVHAGDWIGYLANVCLVLTNNAAITIRGRARLIYDDGSEDVLTFADKTFSGIASGASVTGAQFPDSACKKNGWLVELSFQGPGGSVPARAVWIQAMIAADQALAQVYEYVISAPLGGQENLAVLGTVIPMDNDRGPLWLFNGTVAEDSTAGTHVTSLTVTPGAGNSFEVIGGFIQLGNSGTAQTATAYQTDGSGHMVGYLLNANAQSVSVASQIIPLMTVSQTIGSSNQGMQPITQAGWRISGTSSLVMSLTTTTVSITTTFALVCKLRPTAIPVATLADAVGTPTLTTVTNAVF